MRISLMTTCLVDVMTPDVARSTVRLLERLGLEVVYDPRQTCCGHMHINSGYADEAHPVIRSFVQTFESHLDKVDAIVMPSGSSTGCVRDQQAQTARHVGDDSLAERVEVIAAHTYELSEHHGSAVTGPPPELFGYAGASHPSETKDPAKNIDTLVGRLEDYGATVVRSDASALAHVTVEVLAGLSPVLITRESLALLGPDFPASAAEVIVAEDTHDASDLDRVAAVISCAHTGIALTGTLAWKAGADAGRRAVTLIPDCHIIADTPREETAP